MFMHRYWFGFSSLKIDRIVAEVVKMFVYAFYIARV